MRERQRAHGKSEMALNVAVLITIMLQAGNVARSIRQNVVFVAKSNKNVRGTWHPACADRYRGGGTESPPSEQELLLETLRSIERPPVLIFCRSAAGVERLTAFLRSQQVREC